MPEQGRSGTRRFVFSAFLFLIGIIVGVALVSEFHSLPSGVAVVENPSPVSPVKPPAIAETEQTFVGVAKTVTPAVVNIAASRVTKRGEGIPGFPFTDPFFRRFFGDDLFGSPGEKRERKSESLGSGVIIESDGLIVTNFHVIENADEIIVLLSDKREFKGKVVGSDPKSDLAIVRIDASDLPTVPWGNSSALQVGEYVLAIGSPFGFTQTVTMGIVSAIGRENIGLTDYEDFIQTDAAINPGNSGGAMVNIRGELVGINTAIFSRSGGYMGIGFAVPSDMARSIVESLVKTGKVVRGWLGVAIQDLTASLAKGFGLDQSKGALVSEVMQGSPAEKAGIRRGDIILGFDEKPIEDTNQLRNIVAETQVGVDVTVRLFRNQEAISLKVRIEEQPKDMFAQRGRPQEDLENRSTLLSGIEVTTLTDELGREFDLEKDLRGVIVLSVSPGSPAGESGLKRGDLIMEINRQAVQDISSYEMTLSKAKEDAPILLLVGRKDRTFFLTVIP
ncbi:MAG: DegQ family serine endoprotease [Nitrospiria bacterium]